jgi:hypothetical protein
MRQLRMFPTSATPHKYAASRSPRASSVIRCRAKQRAYPPFGAVRWLARALHSVIQNRVLCVPPRRSVEAAAAAAVATPMGMLTNSTHRQER